VVYTAEIKSRNLQMSFWGATVITNMISAIPYLGADIVSFIWGKLTYIGTGAVREEIILLLAEPHYMWAPLTTKILFTNETNAARFDLNLAANENRSEVTPTEPHKRSLNYTKRIKGRKVKAPKGPPLPTVNDEFMAMLIGLIDGDGYIGITPQSKYIKIFWKNR